ncbi:hypothetical protein C8F01DRAFT_266896 [Mycena amicta]|nr:hypothetical protein C8F01DRAFT_266896 [Mycena amicta]
MSNYLDIPPEVWLYAFTFCDPTTLGALRLTSHYFDSLCTGVLFHTVALHRRAPTNSKIDGSNPEPEWTTTIARLDRQAAKLEMLAASPYAKLARTYLFTKVDRIYDWPISRQALANAQNSIFQASWTRLEATFVSTLPAFRALKRLILFEIQWDAPARRAVEALEALEDLSLRTTVVKLSGMAGKPLALKRLYMFCSYRPYGIDGRHMPLVDPVNLEALQLVEARSFAACIIAPLILRTEALQQPLEQLVQLELPLENTVLAQLHTLLGLCPNLEVLELPFWEVFATRPVSYPPQMLDSLPGLDLPFLYVLKAPLSIVRALVPGRPVEVVHVYGDPEGPRPLQDLLDAFENIAQSTGPVYELAIYGYDFPAQESERVFRRLTGAFPDLSALEICFQFPDDPDSEGFGTYYNRRAPRSNGAVEIGFPDESEYERGYRYDSFGGKFPPPTEPFALTGSFDAPMRVFMHTLLSAAFPLPPHLYTLHFDKLIASVDEEHAAILALEKLLPDLMQVKFWEENNDEATWVREGNVWFWEVHPRQPAGGQIRIVSGLQR